MLFPIHFHRDSGNQPSAFRGAIRRLGKGSSPEWFRDRLARFATSLPRQNLPVPFGGPSFHRRECVFCFSILGANQPKHCAIPPKRSDATVTEKGRSEALLLHSTDGVSRNSTNRSGSVRAHSKHSSQPSRVPSEMVEMNANSSFRRPAASGQQPSQGGFTPASGRRTISTPVTSACFRISDTASSDGSLSRFSTATESPRSSLFCRPSAILAMLTL